MSRLANGKYRTAAGSTLEVSGKHSGVFRVDFDWLEEVDACFDCQPDPTPVETSPGVFRLVWHCDECDGGSAVLMPVASGGKS